MRTNKPLILFAIFCVTHFSALSQKPKQTNASEILHKINKLNVLGKALYIAAHPDDENTRLISYLANGRLLNTAYLSLTRGDGGQNLIGPEIRDELGIIRTQELLSARRIDGGKQFFSRANDFGYSKNPEETYNIWGKDEVLSDIVWVIRNFKPDIIVNRFSGGSRRTHGHHTASALLSREAFDLAADPKAYADQLNQTDTWQTERIFFNTSWWFYGSREKFDEADKTNLFSVNIGEYNPLLGQSYSEIAAHSRSQHKSQGFGSSGTRGIYPEYVEWLAGSKPNSDILDGIDMTWNRVKGGKEIEVLVNEIIENYDPANPSGSVAPLLNVYRKIQGLKDEYWVKTKSEEVKDIIKDCLGLFVEVKAEEYHVCRGEKLNYELEAVNRSSVEVKLNTVNSTWNSVDTTINQLLNNNAKFNYGSNLVVPVKEKISQPYWLSEEGSLGLFNVGDRNLIGKAENDAANVYTYTITVDGLMLEYNTDLIYKKTDPVKGEQYRPVYVIPTLTINQDAGVLIFADESPKETTWTLRSGKSNVSGSLTIVVPKGWRADPAIQNISFERAAEEKSITVQLYPSQYASEGSVVAVFKDSDGNISSKGLVELEHEHIPTQIHFPESKLKVVRLDLKKAGKNIGYIMGAGDDIPSCLEQIGYNVEIIDETDIKADKLQKYDAVITGVRALNTIDRMKYYFDELLEYTKNGGTVIVQYNTSHRLKVENPGPYPLKLSRDRVTVEEAEVRILASDHPVLNKPNKITIEDFKGWKQERGLYFPNEWDDRYTAILSSNDPGEDPKNGGLLVSEYGEGHFIYTGYSWFRNLPPGVPGAYRIFTNLISLGND